LWQAFVLVCKRCATPLLDRFVSSSFVGTGEPVNPPQRPENCTNCGKPFPWNSKPRRFITWIQAIPGKIWTEFKSLSALHIILLLVLVLVIAGAIKWRDLLEILKAIASKK
jgi:hypothetical protein